MKVLVSGGAGFIGRRLAERLIDAGVKEVFAGYRTLELASELKNVEYFYVGDLCALSEEALCHLNETDVVIHTAARNNAIKGNPDIALEEFRRINVNGTINLANECVKRGVRRFIYLSTAKVFGERFETGKPFCANDNPNPSDPYSVSKYESESALCEALVNTDVELVRIRPPLVYGYGVRSSLLNLIRLISWRVPLPLGSVQNLRSFVSIENLISLIIECLENQNAVNKVLLVSDNEDISTPDLIVLLGQLMKVRNNNFPFNPRYLESLVKNIGAFSLIKPLVSSMQLDVSQTMSLLGWKPPQSLHEGMGEIFTHC